MIRLFKKVIVGIMDWFLYSVLSEKQKAFLASLVPDKQKEMLKQMTQSGKRHTQQQTILQIKCALYNLGFTDEPLAELEAIVETEADLYMKRLAAWELSLWHANMHTDTGAKRALEYLAPALAGEKNRDQLRKGAIIQAECHERLGDVTEGKRIIHDLLEREAHPDLYFAAANLEAGIFEREKWINQAFTYYDLQPIHFKASGQDLTYDDLKTKSIEKEITTGPKVSVILPAYNFEAGIHIAIDSILAQTWKNIELLIVDDCSTDETVKVIKQYMKKDSRIKCFQTPVNSGPYVARNIALKDATGDYVTINDADDWSHAEKIELQATHLMKNKQVIANTSEHARLTEELKLYRRGTPGIYIFPNMSSLMFRRKEVMDELGFWDRVRFAADGEFKRRLLKAFGEQRIVDLPTGPLSLPRQSVHSLTGSPAFGYNGFFMGVRKEYVESLEFHHERAASLYYPFEEASRPFPVPEPMLPIREEKLQGRREFDLVIAADFRVVMDTYPTIIEEIIQLKQANKRIGLLQLSMYEVAMEQEMDQNLRQLIDGDHVQMLVYGEQLKTNTLIVINHLILAAKQRYVPDLLAEEIHVVVQEPSHLEAEELEPMLDHLKGYFGKTGTWHPLHAQILDYFPNQTFDQIETMNVTHEEWGSMMRHAK